jgi:hypothetical protein
MAAYTSPSTSPLSRPAKRAIPGLVKFGVATIAFGLVFDLSEHSFAAQVANVKTGFAPGEHAAHLVVLIGMVFILLGVIVDGVHASSRTSRPEGSPLDAVR